MSGARRARRRAGVVALGLALLALATLGTGCARVGEASADPASAARTLYATRCASCHGVAGRGDGPVASRLGQRARVRDLGDPDWQGVVTDERIATVIVEGGPALGLSPLMSKNLDLRRRPELVEELVALVRSFED